MKAYDWLGEGIYFWENAPYRALDWAIEKCAATGEEPAVVGATIHLEECLNLLDTRHMVELANTYATLASSLGTTNLPRNTKSGAHYLDRLLIDTHCRTVRAESVQAIQTVRGSFAEGLPIYPGSKIMDKAHTQIAVRDVACLSTLFLVQFL